MYKDRSVLEVIDLSSGLSSYTLGRTGDIVLEHASCSRQHAKVERDGDGALWVTDLNSAQGTFLDGSLEPLRVGARTQLHDGSTLCFGKSTRSYVVRLPGSDAPKTTTLSADDKKKRLWGGGSKRDRAGASEADRDREAHNLQRWGAAAGALGDSARSDKFLKLMGAKKHKVDKVDASAAPDVASRQSDVFDKLAEQHDAARFRGFGRRGLG